MWDCRLEESKHFVNSLKATMPSDRLTVIPSYLLFWSLSMDIETAYASFREGIPARTIASLIFVASSPSRNIMMRWTCGEPAPCIDSTIAVPPVVPGLAPEHHGDTRGDRSYKRVVLRFFVHGHSRHYQDFMGIDRTGHVQFGPPDHHTVCAPFHDPGKLQGLKSSTYFLTSAIWLSRSSAIRSAALYVGILSRSAISNTRTILS